MMESVFGFYLVLRKEDRVPDLGKISTDMTLLQMGILKADPASLCSQTALAQSLRILDYKTSPVLQYANACQKL